MRTILLTTGHPMPVLGLGTWQLRGAACEQAVRTAPDLGYRHFDTAERYGNEEERAAAARRSTRRAPRTLAYGDIGVEELRTGK